MVPPANSRTTTRTAPKAESGPALSRDSVIERALDLADREGLAAVSIRRLAQDFDVTPMALYWHVKNKDELLAAMGEAILDTVDIPALPAEGGVERLRPLLHRLVVALHRHPGSTELVRSRILYSQRGRRLAEQALGILADAGFGQQRRADLARAALQSVVMLVVGAPGAEPDVPQEDRQEMRTAKRAALTALPVDEFPHLVACAGPLTECEDPEAYYADGIDLYLAGVAALAARPPRTAT